MQRKAIVLALGQGFTTKDGKASYEYLKTISDLHWYHQPLTGETWRSTLEIFVKKYGKPLVLLLYGVRLGTVDKSILEPLVPGLRLVASQGAGYDNIDVDYCTKHDVWVANTPDSVTDATANCAVWLILSSLRGLVRYQENAKSGVFRGQRSTDRDPAGLKLGIVGLGRIGSSVARKMSAFDMDIYYHSRHRATKEIEHASGRAKFVGDLHKLVSMCEVISVHVPLSAATTHLISESVFKSFNGGIFVNTARGKIHDEKALVRALKDEKVSKAALDVFENEPQIPYEFLKYGELADRVLTTPHVGAATEQAQIKLEIEILENVIGVIEDDRPKHPVNDLQPR